jgi:hypothetical protein
MPITVRIHPPHKVKRTSPEKKTVYQLPPYIQNEETHYTNFFLQLDHVSSCCLNMVTVLTFVALYADVFETPVSCTSCSDFLGEVLNLALMLSSVSSVSTVHFLSGFCLAVTLLFSAY